NLDNKALPGVKINVIMGRHAGFLTAASVLARQHEGDGPHLIYVPEAAFDIEQFLTDVERVRSKYGRCLVAVSEGIHDADGTPIAAKLAQSVEKDSHGNVQLSGSGALGDFLSNLVKTKLGVKRVRADTFGYLQRSMAGVYSAVDAAEARAAGRKAAEVAILGDFDGSIAINRVSNDPYEVEFNMVALEEVAAKTRHLPQEYIIGGNDIDRSFRDYLAPIVGELPVIEQI
ncbi:MAG: 6-phosphofructokinase, partial [Myxococcota bacterium]|nr:6-phosphofructokinase [Myxococcota bacterium]